MYKNSSHSYFHFPVLNIYHLGIFLCFKKNTVIFVKKKRGGLIIKNSKIEKI